MALTMQRKTEIVANVHQAAKQGLSLVAAFYSALTVAQMTVLRKRAREQGVFVKVIKNSLARKAFADTPFQSSVTQLKGQLVYVIAKDSPGKAARLVRDFAKENDKLKVKFVTVGPDIFDAAQLEAVASLPTKEEAIARLMSCLQAPVAQFVRTLAAAPTKLVRTLSAVRDVK